MTTAKQLFEKGKQILKAGGTECYAFDAACLFEHFCGIKRLEIALTDKTPQNEQEFISACEKRAGGYPLQYILGEWEFYGLEFEVNEHVLIPRADTETLIDYVLENYNGAPKILDICCGSGCIGITLKKLLPNADVTLCDISEMALRITKSNAQKQKADVCVLKADLFDGFEKYFEKQSFDIIISNPPYIKSDDIENLSQEVKNEPRLALDGGKDGMDCYSAICEKWQGALKSGGELIFESGYDTADGIVTLMTELCYCDIKTKKDLGGITRVVAAKNA